MNGDLLVGVPKHGADADVIFHQRHYTDSPKLGGVEYQLLDLIASLRPSVVSNWSSVSRVKRFDVDRKFFADLMKATVLLLTLAMSSFAQGADQSCYLKGDVNRRPILVIKTIDQHLGAIVEFMDPAGELKTPTRTDCGRVVNTSEYTCNFRIDWTRAYIVNIEFVGRRALTTLHLDAGKPKPEPVGELICL